MARATFGWRRLFGPTVRGHAPRESEVYSPQPSRGTGARRCSCRSVRRAAGKRSLCSSAIARGSGAANLLRHLTTVRRVIRRCRRANRVGSKFAALHMSGSWQFATPLNVALLASIGAATDMTASSDRRGPGALLPRASRRVSDPWGQASAHIRSRARSIKTR